MNENSSNDDASEELLKSFPKGLIMMNLLKTLKTHETHITDVSSTRSELLEINPCLQVGIFPAKGSKK